jgi:hypothetical protein
VRDEVSATADVLRGRVDDGVAAYLGVFDAWRDLRCEFELALSELEFLRLVGPDHPSAGPVADEARRIFERLRASAFLGHLAELFTVREPA